MAVPESKEALIKAINSQFALLMKRIEAVPVDRAFSPEMAGHAQGTQMSAANLVAYLLGWGNLVLQWHQQEEQGKAIDFPETGYQWNQLGLLAQKFYQDFAHITDWSELVARLVANKRELIALVERYTDAQLYGECWYGKWTRGRMIQFNTASPYKNAAGRLRAWEKIR
ncbi:ClbS/DfsB family four-helix bundle protein [Pectobacterium sp. 21LCBS03]|uniref:ClbS/DfsB family four-helix bundle protein n=1 Tax=Pectobacterium sp. 21LCBS03 TaxID=2935858 RepID=UPI00200E59E7|nr:ClbS/DfsB family four-helix bundle protein [Pectobacterium sp. 21LCBS03]UPY97148.1 ClbS/DfsB family four-helix bundle protein [Pectobacterium sp. 21LCBS03]